MSLRAIPLLVFSFILYIAIVYFVSGSPEAVKAFCKDPSICPEAALYGEMFSIPLLSGGKWTFRWGDFILLVTFGLLFVEIVKSTFSSTSSLIDHGLSMLVFVVVLVCFLMLPQAASSVFFLLLVAALIDVIAGYTIGIRVARRDLNIGADH